MTVTVDLVSENLRTGTTTPNTWSHGGAASGVKGVVLMIVHGTSSTDHVSAASYGGTALTRMVRNTDTATEPGAAEIWFLGSNVPQGTQTVSYTPGSTTDDILAVVVTLLASTDLVVIDTDGVNNDAANPSVTLNYNGRSAMAFSALYSGLTAVGNVTVGANCTQLSTTDLSGNFTAFFERQTTAGTSDFAIGVTSANDDVGYAAVAVAEFYSNLTAATGTFTVSGPYVGMQTNRAGSVGQAAPLPSFSTLFIPSSGATMPADYASFTLTGQSANLLHKSLIGAGQGSYALSGQAINLALAHKITAAYGSFALSGQDAALRAPRMSVGGGSFALSGQVSGLLWGHKLAAAYGSVALTGEAATLTPDLKGQAGDPAPFPFLSTLLAPQKSLTAGHGSFALAGQTVAVTWAHTLGADQASFSLTGESATLRYQRLTAEQGAYTLSGQAAGLTARRLLTAEQGAYVLTGNDAGFDVTPAGTPTLSAECGTFALAGQPVDFLAPAREPPRSLLWAGSRLREREPVRRIEVEPEPEPLPRRIRFFTDSGEFSLSGQAVEMWIDDTASTLALMLAA